VVKVSAKAKAKAPKDGGVSKNAKKASAQKGVATRHANKAAAEAAKGNHAEAARLATLAAAAAASSGDQSRAANLTDQAAEYARLAAAAAGNASPADDNDKDDNDKDDNDKDDGDGSDDRVAGDDGAPAPGKSPMPTPGRSPAGKRPAGRAAGDGDDGDDRADNDDPASKAPPKSPARKSLSKSPARSLPKSPTSKNLAGKTPAGKATAADGNPPDDGSPPPRRLASPRKSQSPAKARRSATPAGNVQPAANMPAPGNNALTFDTKRGADVFNAFQIFSLQLNHALKTEEEQQDGAFEDHVANTAWEIFDSGLDVVIADLAGQNTAIEMANRPPGEAKTARNAAWKITAHMLGLSDDNTVYTDDDLCFGVGADGTILTSVRQMNRQLKAAQFDNGLFHYDWERRLRLGDNDGDDDSDDDSSTDGDGDDGNTGDASDAGDAGALNDGRGKDKSATPTRFPQGKATFVFGGRLNFLNFVNDDDPDNEIAKAPRSASDRASLNAAKVGVMALFSPHILPSIEQLHPALQGLASGPPSGRNSAPREQSRAASGSQSREAPQAARLPLHGGARLVSTLGGLGLGTGSSTNRRVAKSVEKGSRAGPAAGKPPIYQSDIDFARRRRSQCPSPTPGPRPTDSDAESPGFLGIMDGLEQVGLDVWELMAHAKEGADATGELLDIMDDIRGVYTAMGKACDAIKGVPEELQDPAITMSVLPMVLGLVEKVRDVKENYGLGRVKRGTKRLQLQEASEAAVAVDRPIKRTRISRA
jgi:hypothetical protein